MKNLSPAHAFAWILFFAATAGSSPAAEFTARRVTESSDPAHATVRVRAGERSTDVIPAFITGKFAEHLGFNIYNGMDAQVLRNPTFAEYPVGAGGMTPDGVVKFQADENRINDEVRRLAVRFGWPESELDGLVQARADALACFWTRAGSRDEVQPSPDTGPYGGRAQRVEVKAAGRGIAQWTWLPLHRQRTFEFEIMARSPDIRALRISLSAGGAAQPAASAAVVGLSGEWRKFTGRLTVPPNLPAEAAYRFSITAESPGQFVVRHAFLRPSDQVGGADPDVVRLLRESRLPILRWPGGNFVSTYHWEDAVGPVERRRTMPNLAWGGIELNTFGTDEFIAFCRAVGCEPMICVNAGSGTAGEAARWVEYCNGPASSPMGRQRAAHGHREPYRVRHWEVGNELWGKWQDTWTSAAGYADRYREFARAMHTADSSIHLYACGAPAFWGREWNDTLIAAAGPEVGTITDHPLIGGAVSPAADPVAVYADFMAVPEVLQQKWAGLRERMRKCGVKEPRLAVTELQVFAHLGRAADTNTPIRLTRDTLPGQGSITEAIYDVLVYHTALRLAPFVEMVTHSATVNHGGGLRKERERVWANPCHYAQAAFAEFAGARLVAVEIEAATGRAPMVLPDLKNAAPEASFSAVDALAAVAKDGGLLVSLVHRGSAGPIRVEVDLADFKAAPRAKVRTLSADVPWALNTLENPDLIKPVDSGLEVDGGRFRLDLKPYSVVRVSISPAR